jgi:hypothetical protein
MGNSKDFWWPVGNYIVTSCECIGRKYVQIESLELDSESLKVYTLYSF